MCGITGVFDPRRLHAGQAELGATAARMAQAIERRGPDAHGDWADSDAGVAFGHRRLSILDLSPTGAQPMHSRSARYVITFNGEIYNFRALREELETLGHSFRGGSDTEVMLAAFEQWGVAESLPKFDGMFAFGLWDRKARELWLARDKLGEKPLYYGWSGGVFLFGSELKALRAHPRWSAQVDRGALSLYLRYNCIPAPHSIYQGVRKLPAASWIKIPDGLSTGEFPEPVEYWSLRAIARQGRTEPFRGSLNDAVDELERRLSLAVAQRLVSDVPVGAFLSGGVDSSLIVAMMRAGGRRPVRTFTVGFEGPEYVQYDEAAHARKIAAHLGTTHAESRLTPDQALAVVGELPRYYDEPFSDSSQIATILVARHARSGVTVCLSGDAGDELFAGYHRHFLGGRIWGTLRHLPRPMRMAAARALAHAPATFWSGTGALLRKRPQIFAEQARKLINILGAPSSRELYLSLVSHCSDPGHAVVGASEPRSLATTAEAWGGLDGAMADFQYADFMSYLPDDILTKVDRATMSCSLEARVPFLSPDLIQFAWSLPDSFKVHGRQGKWILRQLLAKHLPPELILKPKSGFAVPIGLWLRGPLKEWAAALLEPSRLRNQGYLEPERVARLWREHQSGERNRQDELWDALMFQSWLDSVEGAASA